MSIPQSGVKGIHWATNGGGWVVRPHINGKRVYGGNWSDLQMAIKQLNKLKEGVKE